MSLTDEWALMQKLKALDQPNALDVFAGIRTQAERMEKARAMVKKVCDVTFSIVDGKRVTMTQMFVRTYGVDL